MIYFGKYDDITYEDIEEVANLISEVLAACDRVFTLYLSSLILLHYFLR